ncbi:hypothetical protein ACP4OV_012657 [Aristida adscensionis]
MLFRSEARGDTAQLLNAVQPQVSAAMNELLLREFTREEIHDALENIGDLKVPGPDGMPSIFYKNFWEVVGEKVTKEVLDFLNGGEMARGWNDTVISVIPKVKVPERVTELRPISLCNVTYKLISKVLANRLKKILDEIISPSHSAFVPGRLISDNILVAYEVTHYMMNKRVGDTGFAAIKLDMSKAYDKVEWHFLRDMMTRMGFDQRWISLIMKCVMSVSYKIKVNGILSEAFVPERGLRQGDPLSPYLFLICAEGFSALLHQAEMDGSIKGVKICPNAPSISHLLFADDSLLLIRARREDAVKLQGILDLYESVSVQVINKDKSAVMFSKNTQQRDRVAVRQIMAINREIDNERYLGLRVHVGQPVVKTFAYLKDIIWKRIQGWTEKLLSKAGKEILIKSVAQAIPTFAMCCFDISKTLCSQISSMIARYWWSKQDKDKGFTLVELGKASPTQKRRTGVQGYSCL